MSDWEIGPFCAQDINQRPLSHALHLLSLSPKSSRRPSFLPFLACAISLSAGSLIYLHWRVLAHHYDASNQPIAIYFKWKVHQFGVTKEKCPFDLWIFLMHQVPRQTSEAVSGSIRLWVTNIIITLRSRTSLKYELKVRKSGAQLCWHFELYVVWNLSIWRGDYWQ